jgi:HSP20 family protein
MAEKEKKWLMKKWEPMMNDMLSFKKSIDDMFHDFFKTHPLSMKLPSMLKGEIGMWRPEIDMYETDKAVIVSANVPGCDKKDLKINIDNNILTVSGEKKEETEVKKKNFYHKEQRFGSFARSISLPNYIDVNKSKASCEKGVLKIEFPKVKSAQGKGKIIDIR